MHAQGRNVDEELVTVVLITHDHTPAATAAVRFGCIVVRVYYGDAVLGDRVLAACCWGEVLKIKINDASGRSGTFLTSLFIRAIQPLLKLLDFVKDLFIKLILFEKLMTVIYAPKCILRNKKMLKLSVLISFVLPYYLLN